MLLILEKGTKQVLTLNSILTFSVAVLSILSHFVHRYILDNVTLGTLAFTFQLFYYLAYMVR